MTDEIKRIEIDELEPELAEWFEEAARKLLNAGWTGQELSVETSENADGSADITFTWDESADPVTDPLEALADKEDNDS